MKKSLLLVSAIALVCSFAVAQNAVCVKVPAEYSFPSFGSVTTFTLADMNNDGIADIISTNSQNNSGSILPGNSSGFFGAASNFTLPQSPAFSVPADFNGDGKLDLATRYFSNGLVTVRMGNGAGSFTSVVTFTVSGFNSTTGLLTGDFNNDGDQDIFVSNNGTNGPLFLQGNGNGTFSTSYLSQLLNQGTDRVLDLNSDGNLDLVGQTSGNIAVWLGSGNASFSTTAVTTPLPFSFGGGTYNFGDLNNDSHLDMVMTSNSASSIFTVYVMHGNSTGSFTLGPVITYPQILTNPAQGIEIADLNNDGNLEIVLGNSSGYRVLWNHGGGAISEGTEFNGFINSSGVLARDLDGDQKREIINYEDWNGRFVVRRVTPYERVGSVFANDIVVQDQDNDGKQDILTCTNTDDVTVLENTLSGFYTSTARYATVGYPKNMNSFDVNSDGIRDLVTANSNDDISVFIGQSNGSFAQAITINVGNMVGVMGTGLGDFTGDGIPDMAVGCGQDTKVRFFAGTGNGNFVPTATLNAGFTLPNRTYFADLNADGKQDMILSYFNGSNLTRYINSGNGVFIAPQSLPSGATDLVLQDVNADGKQDVISCTSVSLMVMPGNGAGSFSVSASYPITGPVTNMSYADLNSDGIKDVAIGTSTGVIVFKGLPNATFSHAGTFTANLGSARIAVADMNNDGMNDIVTSGIDILLNTTATISATGSLSFCAGGSVTLTGPAGASGYTWMPGGSNANTLQVTTGGNYYVNTNASNCVSSSNSILVIVLPLPVLAVNAPTVCVGTSANLTITGSSTYTWSNGASTPVLNVLPSVTTNYTVAGTGANNCTAVIVATVSVNNLCADVWPGDANSDGIANNVDILELGLHFAQTGPPRTSTSNLWQAYVASNWSGTISGGKNRSHADCNGDGTIDLNDTLAIHSNFNQVHSFRAATGAPQLLIKPDQPVVQKGKWGSAGVFLGDNASPVNKMNGIAFTLSFDHNPLQADSAYLTFPASFINVSNQNLHFRKNEFTSGKIHAASTHTNNVPVTGYGRIATFHFKANPSLATDLKFNMALSLAVTSETTGVLSPLNTGTANVVLIGATVGLTEHEAGSAPAVYPNPVSDFVHIHGTGVVQLVLYNAVGQLLRHVQVTGAGSELDMRILPEGVYFIAVGYGDERATTWHKVIKH